MDNDSKESGDCVLLQLKTKRAEIMCKHVMARKGRLPCGKVTACSAALQYRAEQEMEGPLTNLTGRHVHASSQQISQRAVFCHLLLDRKEED